MATKRVRYRELVEAEILEQVYEDGGDYEASTGYHFLVTQMFTTALLLTRAVDSTPEPLFLARLENMFRFMATIASSSGELPHCGDCDDGRVELTLDDIEQMLSIPVSERNSLRVPNFLGIGTCLFGGDVHYPMNDAAWYGFTRHGGGSVKSAGGDHGLPNREIQIFPQTGIAIAKQRRTELLFFAEPNGIYGKGSHTHNDKLSLVLRVDGDEVICDSGTYCYTRDIGLRNSFRATEAHNTVVVDGSEQNEINLSAHGVFSSGREGKVTSIDHGEQDGGVFFRAAHFGYHSLGVVHTRTVWLSDNGETAKITDLLEGSGRHRFDVTFQVAPGWSVTSLRQTPAEVHCTIQGKRSIELIFTAPSEIWGEKRDSKISRAYGATTPATRLYFSGTAILPAKLVTCFRRLD